MLYTYCRPCNSERSRVWRAKNPEANRAAKKARYETNKARILEQQRQYYERNKQRILEAQRKTPEENRAHVKAWVKANPDKRRAQMRRRVENLQPHYVRELIAKKTSLRTGDIPLELVALKREQLAIKRMARELKKAATQPTNQAGELQ